MSLLVADRLTRRFGPLVAVDDVSFTVDRGEIVGFLGPNGAGKTTTMRMIAGYLPPSSGTARIGSHEITRDTIAAQQMLGYLPEGAPAWGDMTPLALFGFIGKVRGLSRADLAAASERVITLLDLSAVAHRPIETLSKGFRRRVGIAAAILHDPPVLILDEPTDGLDPNQKHQVRQMLGAIAPEKAIIISTHILEEVEAICSRAIVIAGGRVVADALPEDLQARAPSHNAVWLRLAGESGELARTSLAAIEGVGSVELRPLADGSAHLVAYPDHGQDILEAVKARIANDGIAIDEIHTQRGRLEDVFRQLTAA